MVKAEEDEDGRRRKEVSKLQQSVSRASLGDDVTRRGILGYV